MYGLFVSNFENYITLKYGQDTWNKIKKLSSIDSSNFVMHQVYPDQLIGKLVKAAFQVLGIQESDLYEEAGYHFIKYIGQFGYDKVLILLGRKLSDFLNGLDNLHECLKFSYPKLQAPSFVCDNEDEEGLLLHYNSKRSEHNRRLK
jgi:guanylate cyclase